MMNIMAESQSKVKHISPIINLRTAAGSRVADPREDPLKLMRSKRQGGPSTDRPANPSCSCEQKGT